MHEETLLHLVALYGYPGIFAVLMFGLIGLPVPDEVLMAFAGFLVSIGRLQYFTTVVVAAIGSLTGMSFSFLIGYKLGLPFLKRYGPKVHITEHRLESVHHWFERFGKFAVTIGYFIPGVRHLTAYFAGISRWSYGTFLLYALPGSVAWALVFITLGKLVGVRWRYISHSLHRYLLLAGLVIIAVAVVWWLIRRKRQTKAHS